MESAETHHDCQWVTLQLTNPAAPGLGSGTILDPTDVTDALDRTHFVSLRSRKLRRML